MKLATKRKRKQYRVSLPKDEFIDIFNYHIGFLVSKNVFLDASTAAHLLNIVKSDLLTVDEACRTGKQWVTVTGS